MAARVTWVGLDDLADRLAAMADPELVDRAKQAAAEELHAEIDPNVPVRTGALRASGRVVDGNLEYGEGAPYAASVDARTGFFTPVVEERGGELFEEALAREMEDAADG